jgi:hypothetical protein
MIRVAVEFEAYLPKKLLVILCPRMVVTGNGGCEEPVVATLFRIFNPSYRKNSMRKGIYGSENGLKRNFSLIAETI